MPSLVAHPLGLIGAGVEAAAGLFFDRGTVAEVVSFRRPIEIRDEADGNMGRVAGIRKLGSESSWQLSFQNRELLVVVDLYRNATAELAHYALPAADMLERRDLNLCGLGMHHVPCVQYTEAVVPPRAERREEWWIFARLEQALEPVQVAVTADVVQLVGVGVDVESGRPLFQREVSAGEFASPKRLIVQSWRSLNWGPEDIDSTLILSFWPEGEGGRIELVHVNVVEKDFGGVSQGWEKYYWSAWRTYLTRPQS